MATFREYIASLGAAGAVPEAELDELLGRYEWFALARLVRLRQRGGDPSEDGRLGFAVQDRAAGTAPEVDRERLTALCADRKSTRLNSSHVALSRMPSSA